MKPLTRLAFSAFLSVGYGCSAPQDDASTQLLAVDQSYYQGAQGLGGGDLKQALHEIISESTQLQYNQIWQLLGELDADPKNPDQVVMFYSGRSLPHSAVGGAESSDNLLEWNREHVWAKSHGFPRGDMPAFTDLQHLRPCEASLNRLRGEYSFGESATAEEVPGSQGNRLDKASRIWQPKASVRGDIARILFYMDVRYEGTEKKEPDLRLVEKLPLDLVRGVDGHGNGYFDHLSTLIRWHKQDPVDAAEIKRNHLVQKMQKNRNPFIDHPEWAEAIFSN